MTHLNPMVLEEKLWMYIWLESMDGNTKSV